MDIEKQPWIDLYRAALLELDPQKLIHRITEANTAIRARIEVLLMDNGGTREERQALADAIRALTTLLAMDTDRNCRS